MHKRIIKDSKRCPFCDSTSIYRRVRTIQFEKGRRKANKNLIEERVKQYRCQKCKREFDVPIVKQSE